MKQIYIIIIIMIILTRCITYPFLENKSNVKVDESSSNLIMTDRTITFFPFPDSVVTVEDYSDIFKSYDVDSTLAPVLLRDSLYNYLLNDSYRTVTNVKINKENLLNTVDDNFSDTSKYYKLLKMIHTEDLYTFYIPKEQYLKELNIDPDLILIISNVQTGHDFLITQPMNTMNTGTGVYFGIGTSKQILGLKVEFIIWDYNENKPIKFGEIVARTDQSYYESGEIWKASYENLIKEIVSRTPFERKAGVRIQYK